MGRPLTVVLAIRLTQLSTIKSKWGGSSEANPAFRGFRRDASLRDFSRATVYGLLETAGQKSENFI